MRTLFEIQTESGQLWPYIAAALAEKDATISAQSAQITELQATIATAKEKFLSGDHEGIVALISEAEKTTAQKRAEEIQLQIDTLTKEKEALQS